MGEEGRKQKKTKFSSSMIGLPLKRLKCQSVLSCYLEICRLIQKEMFVITYRKARLGNGKEGMQMTMFLSYYKPYDNM